MALDIRILKQADMYEYYFIFMNGNVTYSLYAAPTANHVRIWHYNDKEVVDQRWEIPCLSWSLPKILHFVTDIAEEVKPELFKGIGRQ